MQKRVLVNRIMTTRKFLIVLAAALMFAGSPLHANHGHEDDRGSSFAPGDAALGPDDAAALVRARTGGRVLGVRALRRGDRLYYRVKVLKSGYVRVYRVDARSGAIAE